MKYLEHVQQGMDLLAKDTRTIFVGQAMKYKGHAVSHQVKNYSQEKLLEFPVAEEMQAGFSIGLAIEGKIPICIYPRCNFAILAANQIVNHLDKWKLLTGQQIKVIIKMVVGSDSPLDPDWQHKANYFEGFDHLCETLTVFNLTRTQECFYSGFNGDEKGRIYTYVDTAYKQALNGPGSYIIVEDAQLYSDG